jgi:hypothetical protein
MGHHIKLLSLMNNKIMVKNKSEELAQLKLRLAALEPALSKTFETSAQLNLYLEENKELYKEGKQLFDKIQEIEWDLMSDVEREEEIKHLRLMALKRRGKL